ncbi:MAG: flagellar basal body rod protein FlgC [Ferrovum sp.]|jgi:flagellar basal-body rod protein FlgC|nr:MULTISPECIES: flagellar basal body rod protein FlgC [Ferrovum]KXW57666.1 flagellar basal-body rod protein FlgC [Ferrovum myxofaciens]MBU6994692.1 flagellar basal body rod protein FlgC [Ferrovum myxofaciens]MBW8028195.1 flagellar basal body rod protein FlgC [Ferrovum sp.]MBW8072619.1 flagellar basal body rod protein FlgC [Ferrovum sp.]NDU88779.1 flagellar basal body rod protein FlgC [Ferrovum sp.]
MSLFDVLSISSSALTAQSERLNVVASNLANADSATGADGQPYHAKQVIFKAIPLNHQGGTAVQVDQVINDPTPMKKMYDPGNPLADPQGFVTMPNVNVVEEMVNMISSSRSYQNNVEVLNTSNTLLLKTLTLGP